MENKKREMTEKEWLMIEDTFKRVLFLDERAVIIDGKSEKRWFPTDKTRQKYGK
jgi:hypothetical protein